jgi:hypothetical protein
MTEESARQAPAAPAESKSLRGLDRAGQKQWLWDHSGRAAGLFLVFLAFASMVFLAAIGFKPALFLVVLLVVGVATIALGGRIRPR